MALVAHQAGEAHIRRRDRLLGQLHQAGAGHQTAAVVADVDLDEHAGADAVFPGRCRDGDEIGRMIHGDHDVAALRQIHQACYLARADHFVGDEDVVDAGVGHDFGLAEFGAGDANGPGFELQMSDSRGLVGLGVGAQVFAGSAEMGGQFFDVALQCTEIDQQGRGIDLDARHADVVLEGSH